MFDIIKQVALQRVGGTKLTLNKYSPELLLVAGLAAGVGAVIFTARAHKKGDAIVEAYQADKEDIIHDVVEEAETIEEAATEEDIRKALLPAHMRLVVSLAANYGPGIVLGVASVGCILASHNVQSKRIQALAGALAVVQSGFQTYRARVRAEMGDEADERFYYGAEVRKVAIIEETEDGKLKKRRVNQNHIPENAKAIYYQRTWDDDHHRWQPDADTNEMILRASMSHMNDRLNIYGHVYLNEVLKDLGYEEPNYSRAVGWSRNAAGDNFVDYGLDADINQREGENRWLLDFNVNGYILDDQIGDIDLLGN